MHSLQKPAQVSATPHFVYFLYSSTYELLYVGETDNPSRRFAQHQKTQPLWPEVAHQQLVVFDNRGLAKLHEEELIAERRPRHNIKGNIRTEPESTSTENDHKRHLERACGQLTRFVLRQYETDEGYVIGKVTTPAEGWRAVNSLHRQHVTIDEVLEAATNRGLVVVEGEGHRYMRPGPNAHLAKQVGADLFKAVS